MFEIFWISVSLKIGSMKQVEELSVRPSVVGMNYVLASTNARRHSANIADFFAIYYSITYLLKIIITNFAFIRGLFNISI